MYKLLFRKAVIFLAIGSLLGELLFGVSLFISTPVFATTETVLPEQGSATTPTAQEDLTKLNEEIRQRRERISSLDAEAKKYQDQIDAKEEEVATLSGQLSVLENQIAITNLTIQSTEEKIKTLGLEIEKTTGDIAERQGEIDQQKANMAELLRQLYWYHDRTLLEVTLSYDRFSTFYEEMASLSTIETKLKEDVDRVEVLKRELEARREDLAGKQAELEAARAELETKRNDLEDQQSYHAVLLDQASLEKAQIEGGLEELKREQQSVSGEISSLEEEFRKKLETSTQFPALTDAKLIWPIPPLKGISAYFNDPTYPFRNILEHNAIDIPTPQGTPITAAEDGSVSIARRSDWRIACGDKIPAYNFVQIVHGDKISTLYGHLSSISVVQGSFIRKGDVIGLSGGLPGTAGSGTFVWTDNKGRCRFLSSSTGPHLHFEVRVNGIPDDPLKYLPTM